MMAANQRGFITKFWADGEEREREGGGVKPEITQTVRYMKSSRRQALAFIYSLDKIVDFIGFINNHRSFLTGSPNSCCSGSVKGLCISRSLTVHQFPV